MSLPHSDALVFFGATGDLAYKKIFPALQAMVKRGHLNVPVIGVAKAGWDVDQLGAGKDSLRSTADSTGRPSTSSRPAPLRRWRLQGPRHLPCCAANWAAPSDRCTTWPSRPRCSAVVVEQLAQSGCAGVRGSSSRSRSASDLASAQELNRSCSASSPSRRSSASTITWARSRCRTCSTSASPTRSWSRSGTASTSRACRSPWPRTSASRAGALSTTRPGAIRDVIQNHLFQVLANLAMEPPVGTDSESVRDEKAKVLKAIPPLDPENVVRGQFRGYRQEKGVAPDSQVETFAAVRLWIDTWRWQACPSTSGPASACR